MMHGVRAIMTRIFNYAEGHGLWEEGKRSPSSRAKLGKKRRKRERRILSFEETARVLVLIDEPYKLIIEICITTGARTSEVLGLKWKHVNITAATIKIEQRVWHQQIGLPKSEDSRRRFDGRIGLVIVRLALSFRPATPSTCRQRLARRVDVSLVRTRSDRVR